jgi:hypothetical protein
MQVQGWQIRQPSTRRERAARLKLCTDSTSDETVWVSKRIEAPEEIRGLFIESPLSRREWTLQETIFSARILRYGDQQIYRKCTQGFQSADGVP